MGVEVMFPGVHVQEVESSGHTVVTATTSAAAFVGFFTRGPVNQAVKVTSMTALARVFGAPDARSEAWYGLMQFFKNGGSDAWVVRVANGTGAADTWSTTFASANFVIQQPTASALAELAATAANQAWQSARVAWTAVYSDSAPPESPPTDPNATLSPPQSPPDQDPDKQDLATAAKAARAAGDAAMIAVGYIRSAAALADAAASKVDTDLAKRDPGLISAVWEAAETAATEAQQAALQADKALIYARSAASDDVDQPSDEQQAEAKAAAQNAHAAAATALTAARAALEAANAAEAAAAEAQALIGAPVLTVTAASPGLWGNCVQATIQPSTGVTDITLFDLTVTEISVTRGVARKVKAETYRNLSLDPSNSKYAPAVVNTASELVDVSITGAWVPCSQVVGATVNLTGGADGTPPQASDLTPDDASNGVYRLSAIAPNVFNILCLPDTANMTPSAAKMVFGNALQFCEDNKAFYIFDPPKTQNTVDKIIDLISNDGYGGEASAAASVYFPRLKVGDPLNPNAPREVGPSGTMAGVYARTDAQRGVWKAPAGVAAVLQGADVVTPLQDDDSGALNQVGINALRAFPNYGPLSWGARTLAGADVLDSPWKYISTRRLVDFVEQSLTTSLKWAIFEPNNEGTWSQIRFEVGSFLNGLVASGALEDSFVVCDATTTTHQDIARGIVNIRVGLKISDPAEFIVLQIEQMADAPAA